MTHVSYFQIETCNYSYFWAYTDLKEMFQRIIIRFLKFVLHLTTLDFIQLKIDNPTVPIKKVRLGKVPKINSSTVCHYLDPESRFALKDYTLY